MGISGYITDSIQLQQQHEINNLICQIFKKATSKFKEQYWKQISNKIINNSGNLRFLYKYKEDLNSLYRENYFFQNTIYQIPHNLLEIQKNIDNTEIAVHSDEDENLQCINADSFNEIMEQIDESYVERVQKNQSFLLQMDILFKSYFNEEKAFKDSVKLYLKWVQLGQKHFEQGFLKSIYKQFSRHLVNKINKYEHKQLSSILTSCKREINKFIKVMSQIYEKIYKLKVFRNLQNGTLFNSENLSNFIINNLFNSCKKLIRQLRYIINIKLEQRITKFDNKVRLLNKQQISQFKIPQQFLVESSQQSMLTAEYINPIYYPKSIKCLKQIQHAVTPIAKLKVIIETARSIKDQVDQYYRKINKQAPNLDPDTIVSIIVYIIAKMNYSELIIELELIQKFSTDNSLNCVSGYYLTVFKASIEYIIENTRKKY